MLKIIKGKILVSLILGVIITCIRFLGEIISFPALEIQQRSRVIRFFVAYTLVFFVTSVLMELYREKRKR